jgi:hypothetical protein
VLTFACFKKKLAWYVAGLELEPPYSHQIFTRSRSRIKMMRFRNTDFHHHNCSAEELESTPKQSESEAYNFFSSFLFNLHTSQAIGLRPAAPELRRLFFQALELEPEPHQNNAAPDYSRP